MASGSVLAGGCFKEESRFLGDGSGLSLLLVRRGVAAGGGFLVSFLLGEDPSLLSAFLFLFFLEGIVIDPAVRRSKCERCITLKSVQDLASASGVPIYMSQYIKHNDRGSLPTQRTLEARLWTFPQLVVASWMAGCLV